MADKPNNPRDNRNKRTRSEWKKPAGNAGKRPSGGRRNPTVGIDKQMKDPTAGMRLNKFIANSGVCSRREADIFIQSGNVTVNGKVITEMGYKVKLTDEVKFDGRRIVPEKKEYILLNKPAGFYVTGSIEQNNRTVMDLVAKATNSRIVPVGKLETQAKGLLLFTNDGTLEKKLARKGIRQIFEVKLNRAMTQEDLEKLREGINLQDGFVKPINVDYVENKSKSNLGIELTSTIPHIVQKLFKKLNYDITELDRVTYGGLTKKNLPRGQFRVLSKQEIINLGSY